MAGRRFGVLGILGTLVIAGIAGTIGYGWGVTAGAASATTAASGTVVVAPLGVGFGFPVFGLLFGVLFLMLVVGGIGRVIHGPRGFGPHGPGGIDGHHHPGWARVRGWDGRSVPPMAEPMLRDWHQRAHDRPSGPAEHDAPSGPAAS